MASAKLFHLLVNPPVVDAPDANPLSATTPDYANYTTRLLDPAVPPAGYTQVLQDLKNTAQASSTKHFIYGRWVSRPLPAQTIGAGNWSLYAAHRVATENGSGVMTHTLWGMCIAQWRPGTGVIARFVDAPTGGSAFANVGGGVTDDRVALSTQAGGALTLAAGDCLALELWGTTAWTTVTGTFDYGVIIGGLGQYLAGVYVAASLADTDAYLLAPAAVTYS